MRISESILFHSLMTEGKKGVLKYSALQEKELNIFRCLRDWRNEIINI